MGGQEEASWERGCCRAGKMVVMGVLRIILGHRAGKHRFLGDFDSSRMVPQLPGPFGVHLHEHMEDQTQAGLSLAHDPHLAPSWYSPYPAM